MDKKLALGIVLGAFAMEALILRAYARNPEATVANLSKTSQDIAAIWKACA
jgi:hypothetical protein